MRSALVGFIRNDEGQDLIEYGLLAGIITATVVLAIKTVSDRVQALFTALNDAIK